MTKKDFELIANALLNTKPSRLCIPGGFHSRMAEWETVVGRFAYDLANANPRFNVKKFLVACGMEVK